jgi:hypothetical protein
MVVNSEKSKHSITDTQRRKKPAKPQCEVQIVSDVEDSDICVNMEKTDEETLLKGLE